MACFEQNLHTQISVGDSVLSTTFCGDHVVDIMTSMAYYDIRVGNDVTKDVHCNIIMGHDIVMGAYHDDTMHTDVARILIYYV